MLKPVDGAGGAGIVIGPAATGEEICDVKTKVRANPRGWMAQRPVALSTSPVLIGEKLAPAISTCGRSPSTTAATSGSCPGA